MSNESMQDLWLDIRYAVRTLRQSPGFALVAILTLALGIGATTAIFSVVDAGLLRPLPYPDPQRLVWVGISFPGRFNGAELMLFPDFVEWAERNRSFASLAAYMPATVNLTGVEDPTRLHCVRVTPNLVDVLAIRPLIGRNFLPSENQPDGAKSVILSYGLWQRRFGADLHVLGRILRLDDQNYTIIGVLPRNFRFPNGAQAEALLPQQFDTTAELTRKSMHLVQSIGRLKAGVTVEHARADLQSLLNSSHERFPSFYHTTDRAMVVPLQEHEVGKARLALLVLLGAVGCVLLIACANVANLLLARAASRRREIAVRAALGAGRLRLARQLLTESALIGTLGGVLGLGLAALAVKFFIHLAPAGIPHLDAVAIDGRILAFTFSLSLLTGVLFGLAPALTSGRENLHDALKQGSGRTASISGGKVRGMLVIAELALSIVLLSGAGLLIQSFWRLENVRLGFQPANVLTTSIRWPQSPSQGSPHTAAPWSELLDRIRRIPGTEAAAVASSLPPAGRWATQVFSRQGYPPPERGHRGDNVFIHFVSPAYFSALEIPLRKGRVFDTGDRSDGRQVAIINETLAHKYFPGENPLGQGILGHIDGKWTTIIGVVGDSKNDGLQSPVQPETYLPVPQAEDFNELLLIVRTQARPQFAIPLIRAEIHGMNPNIPLTFTSVEENISTLVAQPRFQTTLLVAFAAIALALAAVGTFGVLSYSVTQRTREIGIRMALGARGPQVLRHVLGQALALTVIGVSIGLTGSLAVTQYLKSLLFEVRPNDPATFVAVSIVLAAVAGIAAWIPARRAAGIDPMIALRE